MGFAYRDGVLCAEDVALEDIGRRFGTPCFVYSRVAIESAYGEYARALAGRDALVCYSVKANSNLAVLNLLARLGAGFDIVSGGELARVLAAGGDARKVVFSGIGKTEAEIEQAIKAGVMSINLESEDELGRVSAAARRLRRRARVAFRVNPEVDAKTHPYISTGLKHSKFGVAHADAERLCLAAARDRHLKLVGIGCHIGSQLTDAAPYVAAVERIVDLAARLARKGIALEHIDAGGGIGIRYRNENPRPIGEVVAATVKALGRRSEMLLLDPGRSIVGNAGVLLTRIEYVKRGAARNFLVVDAAMNDLLRPALYQAWHEVLPVRASSARAAVYDVVGPVCESADFLAKDRRLAARARDYLAVLSAGAYAMVMSSNYNTRPRAPEVMVSGRRAVQVRRRERLSELLAPESIPKW